MKVQQRFEFESPMFFDGTNQGKIRIEGVCYCDEEKGFDIDGIHFNGANILPVIKWIGEGSANEVDRIYNVTLAHCEYLRENWSDSKDLTTDLNQDDSLKQRRA